MAKFKLEIVTDNAAFEEGPATELARILRDLANRVEQDGEFDGVVRDINGNVVGKHSLTGAK